MIGNLQFQRVWSMLSTKSSGNSKKSARRLSGSVRSLTKIQSRKQELKTEAIKQVLTVVKTFDLTLEDCGFRCPTLQDRERARPPIKFVSPDGQAKWSGRGGRAEVLGTP